MRGDSSTGKGEMTATKQISDARHLWRLSSYEDLEELGQDVSGLAADHKQSGKQQR